MSLIEKTLHVTIKKAETQDDGEWVMAASSRDRVNDTIEPAAFIDAIKNISGKLIALWQHESSAPLGYWHDLKYKAGKLIGNLKISETNLGKMVKTLLADGVPLGASIGFRGQGEYNDFGGIHFNEIELLETSIVSVPANPLAQQILKSFGVELPSKVKPSQSVTSDDIETISKAKRAILAANKLLRRKNEN